MKLTSIAAAVLMMSAGAANAEAFTFTSAGKVMSQVGAPGPGGQRIGATMSTIESETVWASARKTSATGICGQWSAPPGSGMTSLGACKLSGPDGAFSMAVGCASANDKNTVANCWGTLTGASGIFQDKTGTASWRLTQGADGKSATSVGSGQWD